MERDCTDKFRLTAEQKEKIKEASNELMDRQFEAMEGSYMELFGRLPSDVAEAMSPKEAARFVDMVVQEAASNIKKGAAAIHKEAANVMRDEAKMAEIRKSFLDSLGYKEAGNG